MKNQNPTTNTQETFKNQYPLSRNHAVERRASSSRGAAFTPLHAGTTSKQSDTKVLSTLKRHKCRAPSRQQAVSVTSFQLHGSG